MRDGGSLYYLHSDHLGSVNVLTTEAGSIVAGSETKFEPFGGYRQQATTATDPTDLGFTRHRHNDELGLIYMGARYFVPEIARFAAPDSIIPDVNNPQTLNRYSYVNNNPLMFVDPDGFEAVIVDASARSNFEWYIDQLKRAFGFGGGMIPYLDTPDDSMTALTGCGYACRLGLEDRVGAGWRVVAGVGIVAPFGYRSVKTLSQIADSGGDIVYRVIRPDENPLQGLVAKAPENVTRGLEYHIRRGSSYPTRFISATRDIDIAIQYAQESGNRIVALDLNKVVGTVYDVSSEIGAEMFLKSPIARNFAVSSSEIVIEGRIPAEAIIDTIFDFVR